MKCAYLLIDFFTLLVPLLFSFHPKLYFYRTWKAFFPAIFLTGIIFVLWDMYFTRLGVWGFNYTFVTGFNMINLPFEEVLFFFCIPYSCVFTFYCLNIFFKDLSNPLFVQIVTNILIAALIVIGLVFVRRKYTASSFFLLAGLLVFANYFLKVSWLGKFYIIYAILLIPFLIVNGILTGTGLSAPIVWYNKAEIIGVRILTIPLEDVFYGMDLIFLNTLIYKYLSRDRLSNVLLGQKSAKEGK